MKFPVLLPKSPRVNKVFYPILSIELPCGIVMINPAKILAMNFRPGNFD